MHSSLVRGLPEGPVVFISTRDSVSTSMQNNMSSQLILVGFSAYLPLPEPSPPSTVSISLSLPSFANCIGRRRGCGFLVFFFFFQKMVSSRKDIIKTVRFENIGNGEFCLPRYSLYSASGICFTFISFVAAETENFWKLGRGKMACLHDHSCEDHDCSSNWSLYKHIDLSKVILSLSVSLALAICT